MVYNVCRCLVMARANSLIICPKGSTVGLSNGKRYEKEIYLNYVNTDVT